MPPCAQELDSSVERFTLPEALQDTNEKLGENVQSLVRPLTDPSVRRVAHRCASATIRVPCGCCHIWR